MSNAPSPGWPHPAAPRQSALWQVLQSWWLLLPVLGCSCLGGLGFLYVGLRARRAAWWIPGIVYTAVGWTAFLLVGRYEQDTAANDWAIGTVMAVWIASIMHAALINPAWLRWLANCRAGYAPGSPATPWAGGPYPLAPLPGAAPAGPPPGFHPSASPAYPPVSPGLPPAPSVGYPPAPPVGFPPAPAGGPPLAADPTMVPYQPVDHFGTGPVAAPASQPPPPAGQWPAGGPLDVNAAGPNDLAALPGFDPLRARQVLAERDRRGAFGSLAEFAAAANLAPHEYARLRDVLVCAPPPGPAPGQLPPGRVLDV
ncbi:helix-hairpin-helix domain-containing protein [Micromonospora sp. NPDC047074]|uniref:ComEA family DNA-binding protein n=1 Tax=Micromonospora sp. NPDC047074 TaxID=3154339 RepID=UPI0033E93114